MNSAPWIQIMRSFVALYLPIVCLAFCVFLARFLRDKSVSKTDWVSWLAVFVGSALLPLVLPIALAERWLKAGLPQPDDMLGTRTYSTYPHRTSG